MGESSDEGSGRVRLTRDQRREHFLDIAAEIILEQGVEGLTMEGLAMRAGVSKALGYRYFTNRDDVLVAVLERENERYDARVQEALRGLRSFRDQVRAMIDVFLDAVGERGALFTVLMQARLGEGSRFEERRRARNREVEDMIAKMVMHEFGVPYDKAIVASTVFLTGTLGLVIACFERGLPRDEVVDTYVSLVMGSSGGLVT